ncbi:MAG: ester cyclase [Actinobacteria bacterium]|nr:ester cyclase [Actinomycetota bacterium]
MGDTKNVVESMLRVWNEHNREQWNAGFTDSAELKAPGGVSGSGPEMAGQLFDIWHDGFPDNQCDPAVIGEDGENGFLEAVFKGAHTGPLNTPSGTVPATGKAVEIPFVVIGKIEGGKYNSFHLYFDVAGLMTQLGVS